MRPTTLLSASAPFEDAALAAHSEDAPAPSSSVSLYDEMLADPSLFGLSPKFFDQEPITDDDDEGEEVVFEGEPHTDHIRLWRKHAERTEHLAALQRGVEMFAQELDGSPGCSMWGYSPDFLHPRHLWTGEGEYPTPHRGYPSCRLPWDCEPTVPTPARRHDLVRWRLHRAWAQATAQIAAAGGVDDDHGVLIDRRGFNPWPGLAEWRRMLFLPPSEQMEERREAAKARKREAQRKQRAEERAARACARQRLANPQGKSAPDPDTPSTGRRLKRPPEIVGAHAYVPLTRGYVARIPAADLPLVGAYNWSVRLVKNRAPVAVRPLRTAGGSPGHAFMNHTEGLTGPVEIITPQTPASSLNNRAHGRN